ncbi:MAG TPA: hypothetical protein VMN82_09325 [Thermoanaerobaculia bacterium]|nr:hypothetical protein [Thermoanaerobaculia bacterium]
MQIPYELEFVENRPTVAARAVALPAPAPVWRARPAGHRDALDRLLDWAFRVVRRFDGR